MACGDTIVAFELEFLEARVEDACDEPKLLDGELGTRRAERRRVVLRPLARDGRVAAACKSALYYAHAHAPCATGVLEKLSFGLGRCMVRYGWWAVNRVP